MRAYLPIVTLGTLLAACAATSEEQRFEDVAFVEEPVYPEGPGGAFGSGGFAAGGAGPGADGPGSGGVLTGAVPGAGGEFATGGLSFGGAPASGGAALGGSGGVGAGGIGVGGVPTGSSGAPNTGGGAPGAGGSGCGSPIVGGPWVTTAQYETRTLTICGQPYNVKTNAWGAWNGSQQLTIGGSQVFSLDFQNASSGTNVMTYPAVYRGVAQDGRRTDTALPRQVNSLTSVKTGFHTNSTQVSGVFNAAYDVYFTQSGSYTGGEPDVFLMVWIDNRKGLNPTVNGGRGYSCSAAPPYVDSCAEPAKVSIPGAGNFFVFVGTQHSGKLVISYVRDGYTDAVDFDLMDFVADATQKGYTVSGKAPLSRSMHLASVQAGFEIKSGGAGLKVSKFYADVAP